METPAGSGEHGMDEKELSRNPGDPSRSLQMQSTQAERTIHKQAEAVTGVGLVGSTWSVGKPRTWGSDRTK